MPEPPLLAPPDMEEQRLYPKPMRKCEPAPHPVAIGVLSYFTEETNFGRLVWCYYFFGPLPKAYYR